MYIIVSYVFSSSSYAVEAPFFGEAIYYVRPRLRRFFLRSLLSFSMDLYPIMAWCPIRPADDREEA